MGREERTTLVKQTKEYVDVQEVCIVKINSKSKDSVPKIVTNILSLNLTVSHITLFLSKTDIPSSLFASSD